MTPTRNQILDILKGIESNDPDLPTPEWMQGMSRKQSDQLGANIMRLAILGLLVHPETSASTQAEIDLEYGSKEGAANLLADIRVQALELAK